MTTASPVPLAQLLDQASWAHRLARNLVHDSDEADDLVQETWLAALRRPPSAGGSLRPWLGTVLRRQRGKRALGERRRGAREEAVVGMAEEVPSPEALLGRMEAQKLLAGLVTSLEEPYRQTILLRYYEGLTSAEIASPIGTGAGHPRGGCGDAMDHEQCNPPCQARRSIDALGPAPGAVPAIAAIPS
jgi:RNA polymerase sigma-70 factor (ECF subfamily)